MPSTAVKRFDGALARRRLSARRRPFSSENRLTLHATPERLRELNVERVRGIEPLTFSLGS